MIAAGLEHDAQAVMGGGVVRLQLQRPMEHLQGGRVLDYLGKPNRKMCSLYLSMMDKMGVKLDSFGDSKEALTEI